MEDTTADRAGVDKGIPAPDGDIVVEPVAPPESVRMTEQALLDYDIPSEITLGNILEGLRDGATLFGQEYALTAFVLQVIGSLWVLVFAFRTLSYLVRVTFSDGEIRAMATLANALRKREAIQRVIDKTATKVSRKYAIEVDTLIAQIPRRGGASTSSYPHTREVGNLNPEQRRRIDPITPNGSGSPNPIDESLDRSPDEMPVLEAEDLEDTDRPPATRDSNVVAHNY